MDNEEIKAGYVRVSQVIAPYVDYSHINQEVLAAKAAIGTEVHSAIESHYLQEFFPISLKAQEYIPSFKAALHDSWFSTLKHEMLEERMYHETLKLTGQIDMLAVDEDGKKWLIDFKTTAQANLKVWKIQMAMYVLLLANNGVDHIQGVRILHLKKKAAYSLIPVSLSEADMNIAFYLIKAYWHFK